MKLHATLFWAAVALASLSGCASPERPRVSQAALAADPFAGKWEGRWTSAKHHDSGGRLRCTLTPVGREAGAAPGTGCYLAHFTAHWLTFSSTYDVPLTTRRERTELRFHGTHDLPAIFGGTYTFDGRATAGRFDSTYTSSYDHGTFQMTRPLIAGR